jgi:two-component system, LytTR family, sensor kinase
MNEQPLLRRSAVGWLILIAFLFGLATVLGLFDASQSYLLLHHFVKRPDGETPMSGSEVLILSLTEWHLWVPMAVVLIWCARRFPFAQHRWLGWLAVMVLLSLVVSVAKIALDVPIQFTLRHDWGTIKFESVLDLFLIFFCARFLIYVLICWAVLGVTGAVDHYRKFRERELKASQLETRLAQAQLQVLKMQLHPHFLFNTLNAISALIHQDVEVADRMLARLGELLRLTLENAGTQEVTLAQELDFIGPYLEIQQSRFGSRLVVRLDIDPEAMDACVPNLILQPLVENAIQHGIAPRPGGGRIEVNARRVEKRLHLEVRDDGPGMRESRRPGSKHGVGLANTRARLEQMYGSDHTFHLNNHPEGGLLVVLELPFRSADEATMRNSEKVDGKNLAPELV